RHDQQGGVDAGGAGQHVVHEALVARHVDETQLPAIAQVAVGIAEIDGDAARLLFLQAVGIDAGQRLHQRGLAVVDMACRADDHGARFPSWPTNSPSSSSMRRSNSRASCSIRPITGTGSLRKAAASLSRPAPFPLAPRAQSAKDGNRSTGSAPEPIWPFTAWTSAVNSLPSAWAKAGSRRSACARMSLAGRASARMVGSLATSRSGSA